MMTERYTEEWTFSLLILYGSAAKVRRNLGVVEEKFGFVRLRQRPRVPRKPASPPASLGFTMSVYSQTR